MYVCLLQVSMCSGTPVPTCWVRPWRDCLLLLLMQTDVCMSVTGQYVFWHSSAHMLGEAMERLFVVVVDAD